MRWLNESEGGVILGCGGHATFIRFDHRRKHFSFVEPNFGTLQFTPKLDQDLDVLALDMAICYA